MARSKKTTSKKKPAKKASTKKEVSILEYRGKHTQLSFLGYDSETGASVRVPSEGPLLEGKNEVDTAALALVKATKFFKGYCEENRGAIEITKNDPEEDDRSDLEGL